MITHLLWPVLGSNHKTSGHVPEQQQPSSFSLATAGFTTYTTVTFPFQLRTGFGEQPPPSEVQDLLQGSWASAAPGTSYMHAQGRQRKHQTQRSSTCKQGWNLSLGACHTNKEAVSFFPEYFGQIWQSITWVYSEYRCKLLTVYYCENKRNLVGTHRSFSQETHLFWNNSPGLVLRLTQSIGQAVHH